MSEQQSDVLFIHALTSLHPGSGTALGVVDLPVQRERHTQWPTVPGSAIKGVLRDAVRRKFQGDNLHDDVAVAFGRPTEKGENSEKMHAGALSFTDARIIAYPVRSLKGTFAWVTCPAVLERYQRDRALAGEPASFQVPALTGNKALANNKVLGAGPDGKDLVLEEFPFRVDADCGAIAEHLAKGIQDAATAARFRNQLAVIADDYFNHFVRNATEVVARIALDYMSKTVNDGALFYQEFLPPETLFYSLVIAAPSRNGNAQSAGQILESLRANLPGSLQIGGDETTGKGLCALKFAKGA